MPNNEYMKAYMAERRKNRRAQLVEMLGNQCRVCKSEDGLEFNHIDLTTKSFTLSGAGLDKSWASILEEVNKCELLCSTCHKDKTREQWRAGELQPWNKDLHGDHHHGSARMYHEGRCRCERCKKAKKLYRAGKCSNSDVVA